MLMVCPTVSGAGSASHADLNSGCCLLKSAVTGVSGGYLMANDLMEMFMVNLYFYVLPVFSVAAGVLGIIIFTGKTKSVRFLGLGIFLSALIQTVTKIVELFRRSSVEKAYQLAVPMNIFNLIIGLSITVCICIFIHKNYGWKFIYALSLSVNFATMIIGLFVPVLISRAVSSTGLKGSEMTYWIEFLNGISSFLFSSVNSIIFIVVFFRNRKAEKVIPHYWLIRLLLFIWSMILLVLNSAGWYALIKAEDHAAVLAADTFRNSVLVSTGFITALTGLAVPLYILIASKRYARLQEAGQEETV